MRCCSIDNWTRSEFYEKIRIVFIVLNIYFKNLQLKLQQARSNAGDYSAGLLKMLFVNFCFYHWSIRKYWDELAMEDAQSRRSTAAEQLRFAVLINIKHVFFFFFLTSKVTKYTRKGARVDGHRSTTAVGTQCSRTHHSIAQR